MMAIEVTTRAANLPELARLGGLLNYVADQPGATCAVEGFHGLRAARGAALLVEPLNSPPYVFCVAEHMLNRLSPPSQASSTNGLEILGTITTFASSTPWSGTEALRARIDATLFFERVVREHQAQRPACLDELTPEQRDFVQDALANWDSTSDEEMAAHWCAQGITPEQAQAALKYRNQFTLNPSFTLWPVADKPAGPRGPAPRHG